jgi:hypothetical protein
MMIIHLRFTDRTVTWFVSDTLLAMVVTPASFLFFSFIGRRIRIWVNRKRKDSPKLVDSVNRGGSVVDCIDPDKAYEVVNPEVTKIALEMFKLKHRLVGRKPLVIDPKAFFLAYMHSQQPLKNLVRLGLLSLNLSSLWGLPIPIRISVEATVGHDLKICCLILIGGFLSVPIFFRHRRILEMLRPFVFSILLGMGSTRIIDLYLDPNSGRYLVAELPKIVHEKINPEKPTYVIDLPPNRIANRVFIQEKELVDLKMQPQNCIYSFDNGTGSLQMDCDKPSELMEQQVKTLADVEVLDSTEDLKNIFADINKYQDKKAKYMRDNEGLKELNTYESKPQMFKQRKLPMNMNSKKIPPLKKRTKTMADIAKSSDMEYCQNKDLEPSNTCQNNEGKAMESIKAEKQR